MASLRVLGHAFRAWRRNRRWDKHEPETPYLADLLSGGPICLHVGASDGRHSYVMTQVAPQAQIHAFEPSAFSFEVLRTCLAWHGIGRQVTAVHAAVADRPGRLILVTPKKSTGRLGRNFAFVAERAPQGRLRPDMEDHGCEIEPTPVLTLDDYCRRQGLERVDFIRLDVEGAEQWALQGAQSILDRDRPHVLIEIHPLMLRARFGGSAEAVVEMFRSRGYRMFAVEADRLQEETCIGSQLRWKDYFFVHPCRASELPDGVFKARMSA